MVIIKGLLGVREEGTIKTIGDCDPPSFSRIETATFGLEPLDIGTCHRLRDVRLEVIGLGKGRRGRGHGDPPSAEV